MCTTLSSDQNTDSPTEIRRIQDEHPNEANTFQRGRLKGILRPTRHIGGALLKERIAKQFLQKGSIQEPWNPPYTNAYPEITCHPIKKEDKFVILASDGLWDLLSNEEAICLVTEYQELLDKNLLPNDVSASTFLIERALSKITICDHPSGLSDDLKDISTITKIMEIPEQQKRNIYDDITVSVIFLDRERNSNHLLHPTIKPKMPRILDRVNNLKTYVETTPLFDLITSGSSAESVELKQYLENCWPVDMDRWTTEKMTTQLLLESFGIVQ